MRFLCLDEFVTNDTRDAMEDAAAKRWRVADVFADRYKRPRIRSAIFSIAQNSSDDPVGRDQNWRKQNEVF
jgi:hypothetical protein